MLWVGRISLYVCLDSGMRVYRAIWTRCHRLARPLEPKNKIRARVHWMATVIPVHHRPAANCCRLGRSVAVGSGGVFCKLLCLEHRFLHTP